MITSKDNTLFINSHVVTLPIRIKQILIIQDLILVALGFDAVLDCGYKDTWTLEIDSKWNLLHNNFNDSSLYCFDKNGILVWKFCLNGFFDISKIDNNSIENDLRIKSWILNNPDKSNVFIVLGDEKLLVDYKTGEIYQQLEMR